MLRPSFNLHVRDARDLPGRNSGKSGEALSAESYVGKIDGQYIEFESVGHDVKISIHVFRPEHLIPKKIANSRIASQQRVSSRSVGRTAEAPYE